MVASHITHMRIGPVRFKANPRSQLAQNAFNHRLVVRETGFEPPEQAADITIQELYNLLIADEQRNELIVDDVLIAWRTAAPPSC